MPPETSPYAKEPARGPARPTLCKLAADEDCRVQSTASRANPWQIRRRGGARLLLA
jgi:hypothetical protein